MSALLRYLTLGVGEPEADTPEKEAETTGDDTLDDLLDVIDPTEGDVEPEKVDAAAVKEARRRLHEKETELENERVARRVAEARITSTPAKDTQYEAEERELAQARSTGTAEQVGWLQWRIDKDRQARTSEQTAKNALLEARDSRDQAAFERLEITKPSTYKRYAARVEKAVSDLRQQGNTMPRMEVLKWMIGEDALKGDIKPKSKKTETGETQTTRVDRGRMPGARTDVRGKGGQSEKEKRIERLRNQFI